MSFTTITNEESNIINFQFQKVIWNKNLMQINRKDDNKNHSTCNYSIKMHKKCFKKKKYRKPRKPNKINRINN